MSYAFILLIFASLFSQQEVPYKPAEEYEVIIDYKFQERPPVNRLKADFEVSVEDRKKVTAGPLPYLKIQIKLLKLSEDEIKVKVVNKSGSVLLNRKATLDTVIKLDVGFIDDVKDGVSSNQYTITLYSDSKNPISQIHMNIMEDGTFMVNNAKKGKF